MEAAEIVKPTASRTRAPRSKFTSEQSHEAFRMDLKHFKVAIFEEVFSIDRYPDRSVIEQLADSLGVQFNKVKGWFCNRRSKSKRQLKRVSLQLMREEVFKSLGYQDLLDFHNNVTSTRDHLNALANSSDLGCEKSAVIATEELTEELVDILNNRVASPPRLSPAVDEAADTNCTSLTCHQRIGETDKALDLRAASTCSSLPVQTDHATTPTEQCLPDSNVKSSQSSSHSPSTILSSPLSDEVFLPLMLHHTSPTDLPGQHSHQYQYQMDNPAQMNFRRDSPACSPPQHYPSYDCKLDSPFSTNQSYYSHVNSLGQSSISDYTVTSFSNTFDAPTYIDNHPVDIAASLPVSGSSFSYLHPPPMVNNLTQTDNFATSIIQPQMTSTSGPLYCPQYYNYSTGPVIPPIQSFLQPQDLYTSGIYGASPYINAASLHPVSAYSNAIYHPSYIQPPYTYQHCTSAMEAQSYPHDITDTTALDLTTCTSSK